MLDRLMGVCLTVLAAAMAIYVAVRLVESVAAALVIIVAAIGGTVLVGFVVAICWRRYRPDRW
jgi:hypothetical protein